MIYTRDELTGLVWSVTCTVWRTCWSAGHAACRAIVQKPISRRSVAKGNSAVTVNPRRS